MNRGENPGASEEGSKNYQGISENYQHHIIPIDSTVFAYKTDYLYKVDIDDIAKVTNEKNNDFIVLGSVENFFSEIVNIDKSKVKDINHLNRVISFFRKASLDELKPYTGSIIFYSTNGKTDRFISVFRSVFNQFDYALHLNDIYKFDYVKLMNDEYAIQLHVATE